MLYLSLHKNPLEKTLELLFCWSSCLSARTFIYLLEHLRIHSSIFSNEYVLEHFLKRLLVWISLLCLFIFIGCICADLLRMANLLSMWWAFALAHRAYVLSAIHIPSYETNLWVLKWITIWGTDCYSKLSSSHPRKLKSNLRVRHWYYNNIWSSFETS